MELEYSRSFHDRKEIYLQIIYLKTASLFELCSLGPGIIAGLNEKVLDALASYGRLIGMGFQIVDDIINVSLMKRTTRMPSMISLRVNPRFPGYPLSEAA